MTTSIRKPITLIAGAACVAIVMLMLLTRGPGASASAAAHISALQASQGGPVATQDRVVLGLEKNHATLNLPSARVVIDDDQSTVWATRSTEGQICLVEKVKDPTSIVQARFGCEDPSEVAAQGMIAGVPGHWYGIAPDGVSSITAHAEGRDTQVAVRNNAFRLPGPTDRATVVDGAPLDLPSQ